RPAGRVAEVPGVAGGAEGGIDGVALPTQLRRVGLPHHHAPGRLEPSHEDGVAGRRRGRRPRGRTARGGVPGRVLQVLDRQGDAGQLAGIVPVGHLPVDSPSRGHGRVAVDGHEGVDRLVERLDAIEGVGHQLPRPDLPGPDRFGQPSERLTAKVQRSGFHEASLRPGVAARRCPAARIERMTALDPASVDLDHVAVAVEHWRDAWPRYAGDLAGQWVSGGESVGFAASQLRFANGMKVEILQPHRVDANDFLRRFLDRNGPAPHHLTYKAHDIVAALGMAEEAGYRPVNVDVSDPFWKEAFLHPKDAPGVVVQLAQAAGDWSSPPFEALPRPRVDRPATLLH